MTVTLLELEHELAAPDLAERLAELSRQWGIVRLELFGSALREDFGDDSDIDLLYTAADDAHWGFEFVTLCEEFERLFGRPVDLVSRRAVEQSTNPIRRQAILSSARTIYERGG
jgi:predicted nucleotidyltransferase